MTETLRRGYPGMKSVKDMPVVQDGPPPGGFPSVRYARRLPSTGPTGPTLFLVSGAIMAYGFYLVGQTNIERRAHRAEKFAARKTLVPVLQAEEDRRWVEHKRRWDAQEAEVMKNVKDWKVGESVYSDNRWMPPTKKVGIWAEHIFD
jgi:NADH dehydrogenase (ubiquinone) 1 alpha subcomplex subunit 13